MKTNEMKKGTRVKLRNGWEAELMDNNRGMSRLAKVYGDYTEIGSVYTHNIVAFKQGDEWSSDIQLTKRQKELMDFMASAHI
jgi:hypothetical protein